MNFQAVDQANGNNIKIWAIMTEHLGVTQKDGKLKLKCKLQDDDGVTHNAHIHKGNGELPGVEHLNQRMEFNLSTFQGTYNNQPYTGYSGFWTHGATINAPQGSQQAPSQPAQATNYQPTAPQGKKEPNWDAIARGKVRNSVVCAFIGAPIDAMPSIKDIEHWVNYIMTGIDPNNQPQYQANPDHVGDNPPPPVDDDIPF